MLVTIRLMNMSKNVHLRLDLIDKVEKPFATNVALGVCFVEYSKGWVMGDQYINFTCINVKDIFNLLRHVIKIPIEEFGSLCNCHYLQAHDLQTLYPTKSAVLAKPSLLALHIDYLPFLDWWVIEGSLMVPRNDKLVFKG